MALTPAQTNAKNVKGRALLVSAAAGSGKTYTLTQRIIDTIINDSTKSISRMLIVTFTRSAAGELKTKIGKALTEAIEKRPDDPRLQKELINLGSAHISTIDSFFSAPIRANFEKLGLPASMRLADDAELVPIRQELFKETLELFFSTQTKLSEGELDEVGRRTTFTDLLGLISGIRDSSELIPTLTRYYYKLLTSPKGIEKLNESAERLNSSAELDFFDTKEGAIIKEQVLSTVKYTALQLKNTLATLPDIADEILANSPDPEVAAIQATAIKEAVWSTLDDDLTKCISLEQSLSSSYSEAAEVISKFKFINYVSLKGDKKSSRSEDIKNLRSKIIQPVKDLKNEFFSYTPEAISRQFIESAKVCEVLCLILKEFDRRYSEEKLNRGVCEFSDMPKFILRLLENEDGTPTSYASSLAAEFDEIYIDEYQDVNAIQDKIFEIIGGNRRFMVGDIKQSIYGFRDADPSIFARYKERFPEYDENMPDLMSEDGGNSIFMSENFRCDETVIDFSNAVCSEIFMAFAKSIGYDSKHDDLRFAKYNKDDPNVAIPPMHPVKVTLIQPPKPVIESPEDSETNGTKEISLSLPTPTKNEEEVDKYSYEATVTANEIARLIRDKNERNADNSSISAGDIAVLVRSHELITTITEALSKLGIKYVTTEKNQLLQSNSMKTLVDLLTVIDNPRNDIPMCRVLTADPEKGEALLDFNELLMLRAGNDAKKSLFDALLKHSKEESELAKKCEAFASSLESFRLLSSRVSADKLLRAISRHPLFSAFCDCEAYTYLYNSACSYSKNSWNGLYSFLTYFKALIEKGSSGSEPVKAQADEVTVITMHQSKGLEYKVCFLFGLGKEFNFMDISKPFIFSRELGLSMKLLAPFDENADVFARAQRVRESNLLWRAASILERNKLLEEEARIFYVALTRAKERLYLSATLSKSYDDLLEDQYKNCYDLPREIKNSKTYIKWTLLTLSRLGRANSFFELNAICSDEVPPLATRLTAEEVESNAYGITEADKSLAVALNTPHGETDTEKILSMIPAKVAASKVTESMLDNSIFIPIPTGTLFSESDEDTLEQSSDTEKQIKNRIMLMRSKKTDFDSLLEVNKKPTAAEKGSATHLFLQFCDYEKLSLNGLDAETERLKNERFITSRTAEIIDREQLSGFFKSELFSLIENAKLVRREFRFGMFRSASDFTSRNDLKSLVSDKKIFVQGSIDLLIETADGEIILCDYKTDKITKEEKSDPAILVANMKEKHGSQLEEYRFAVREIFGKDPCKIYIYSVPLGQVIEL